MKKYITCLLLIAITICSFYTPANATVPSEEPYIFEMSPEDITLLLELDRESESLAISAEEIGKVESIYHEFSLEERNEFFVDMLGLLDDLEIPMMWNRLPDRIRYHANNRYFSLAYFLGERNNVWIYIYTPLSNTDELMVTGGYLDNTPRLLGEKIYLYSSWEEERSVSFEERFYHWMGYTKIGEFYIQYYYGVLVEDPARLSADEMIQILSDAPVAPIDEYYIEINKEPVDIVKLAYCISGAVSVMAIITGVVTVVVVKRIRIKKAKINENGRDSQ